MYIFNMRKKEGKKEISKIKKNNKTKRINE